jgi:hypothetical protein
VQQVIVTEQLDPNLDWTTFQVGDFTISGQTYAVTDNHGSYSTRLDLTKTLGIYLDVTAGINLTTGLATWTFTSIDPATGDLPSNIFTGFLPPDKNPPQGEAFVTYTVRPRASDTTGTTINARATVVFDTNAPINTNSVTNTIDAGPPTSRVKPLPPFTTPSFTVRWSGADDPGGSGIASYDVFVSDNGRPFTPFLTGTTQTSAVFTGKAGHTYGFYSVATDNVGNRQATPAAAQATVRVASRSSSGRGSSNPGGSPPPSPDQLFLTQLYPDLFGRPADAAGLAFWAAALDGGQSRAQVVQEMVQTPEYLSNAVNGLYEQLLHHAADPSGIAYWLSALASGDDMEHVEAAILASDEYFRTRAGGTSSGYLSALYGDVLGRGVDPAAAAFYGQIPGLGGLANEFSTSLRESIAASVLTSPEAYQGVVQGFYQAYLHRPADAAGLAFWVSALQRGTPQGQVLAAIAGSDEAVVAG